MKTYINLILAYVVTVTMFAQEKPIKIVFDVTRNDASVHESTIRHVKAMSAAYPDSSLKSLCIVVLLIWY